MITEQHIQESLSRSYIHALAGIAGINLVAEREFDYGLDGTFRKINFRGKRRVENSFPLDFQLKCTINWEIDGEHIIYDLESKTYNDLVTRNPCGTGAVLIVLCLPKDKEKWIEINEDFLKLQKCCYFAKLEGEVLSREDSKKRIRIPKKNVLTHNSIHEILDAERSRRIGAHT